MYIDSYISIYLYIFLFIFLGPGSGGWWLPVSSPYWWPDGLPPAWPPPRLCELLVDLLSDLFSDRLVIYWMTLLVTVCDRSGGGWGDPKSEPGARSLFDQNLGPKVQPKRDLILI